MRRFGVLLAMAAVSLAVVVVAGASSRAAEPIACDLNGDGFSDLAVCAPGTDHSKRRGAGEVMVFMGSAAGLSRDPSLVLRVGRDGIPGRAKHRAEFGAAIGCGDVNGDGNADLVVGAPGEKVAGEIRAGAIYVAFGGAAAPLEEVARFTAYTDGISGPPAENAAYGFAVAVGDLIGDGFGDVAIGVPGDDAVVVLAGSPSGLGVAGAIRYENPELDELGAALAVGDIDGNGESDLAVGAPGSDIDTRRNAGALALWLGGDPASGHPVVTSHATAGISGKPRRNGRFGHAVVIGDHDGDGYDDVVVGAPGYRAGRVKRAGDLRIIYGASNGLGPRVGRYNLNKLEFGPRDKDGFGWAAALADLDGNGAAELIVGTPRRHGLVPQEGLLTVIPREGSPLNATLESLGQPVQSGQGLGANIVARDFDGNGRADLAIGLQGAGEAQLRSGAVAVIYGRRILHLNPPKSRPTTLQGRRTGARFGVVAAGQAPADLPLLSIPLLNRSEWGARDPATARLTQHRITRLTIHHAGNQLTGTGPAVYRNWQAWHMDGRHWGDIAYHIIIGADGRVFAARPLKYRGDTGTNYDPTGHLLVVVEGNFDIHQPTAVQLDILPKVVAWAARHYNLPLEEVLGHRDHASTTCPGENLYPYIASGDLASDVDELLELGRAILDK